MAKTKDYGKKLQDMLGGLLMALASQFKSSEPVSPLGPSPTPDPFLQKGYEQTGPNSYRVPSSPLASPTAPPTPPTPSSIPSFAQVEGGTGPQATPFGTPAPAGNPGYGRNEATRSAPTSDIVKNALLTSAKKFGVDPNFMFDAAMAESNLNPEAQNPAGSAGGLFQFLDSTWKNTLSQYNKPGTSLHGKLPNEDKMDPVTNALVAGYLIGNGQLGKWDASKTEGSNAWGKNWSEEELRKLGYYDQTLNRKTANAK